VTLDHRDFVEALRDWPAPVDGAWISLSLHHLLAPAKLSLMRQIRRIVRVAAVARRPTSLLAGYVFQSQPQQPKIPNERRIKANHA
jgi:hypothetical protein